MQRELGVLINCLNPLNKAFSYAFQSRNCKLNKFGISKGGRIDLEDVEFYCGQGTFNVSSTSNKLNLVLLSSYSAGGRFFCNLVVKGVRLSPGKCTCGHKNTVS